MVALRTRPKAARSASFGLSAFCLALMPVQIGYQDLAAFIARQPGVSERWREHLIASPFGTIHAATFSFPQPVGTAMPEPLGYELVNFDPRSFDVSRNVPDERPVEIDPPPIVFPVVNRALKGDRLPLAPPPEPPPLPQLQPIEFAPPAQPQPRPIDAAPPPEPTPIVAAPPSPPEPSPIDAGPQPQPEPQPIDATPQSQPAPQPLEAAPQPPPEPQPAPSSIPGPQLKQAEQADPRSSRPQEAEDQPIASAMLEPALPHSVAVENPTEPLAPPAHEPENAHDPEATDDTPIADVPPEIPDGPDIDPMQAAHSYVDALSFLDDNLSAHSAQVYFGIGAMGSSLNGLERWAPGAEPVLVARAAETGIKLAALTPAAPDTAAEGETVAPKGEIGVDTNRNMSPAQRLGLEGKGRAKAEKCLADAVYFESRGEPLRGQQAVAQVVMNRVFSGFYPNSVCGVVYQNANRHLACQFTFACDGKPDRVDEPDMWEQAKRISKETLDGQIWLPEVGHATHYHAYWVHPSWVREMKKMYKLGVHTFYRPRAWGSGEDAPVWGNVPSGKAEPGKPEAAVSKPEATGGKPEAAVTKPEAAADKPEGAVDKSKPTAKL
jgi:spore germination cell wall hydrolase CwlJ-like protein